MHPDLSCFAKVLAGGMPGGAVAGRADIMSLFDQTGDPRHDRFERVTHLGTFNAAPLSAAAGIAVLKRVATGEPIEKANAMTKKLHAAWEDVLEKHGVAGCVYGPCSTFHVYFESDEQRIRAASSRKDLHSSDAKRLKGMPAALIREYQFHMRLHGVDNMSSTGGVLSAAHTGKDLEDATAAFEKTVLALLDQGMIHGL